MSLETLSKAASLAIVIPTMLVAGSLPYLAIKSSEMINRAINRRRIAKGLIPYDNENFDLSFMRNYIK